MDLNYLLKRQQVELFRAKNAKCDAARQRHGELALRYELKIECATQGAMRFHRSLLDAAS